MPPFYPPKLASSVAIPPEGPLWIHELKMDGYRMQLHVGPGAVRMFTRNGLDWTSRFPGFLTSSVVRDRIRRLDDVVLDGELTMVDEQGMASFCALQQSLQAGRSGDHVLAYFAFDLLYSQGQWLIDEPLEQRKHLLRQWQAVLGISEIQYLDHVATSGQGLLDLCRVHGLEGIVSKRLDRPYRSGRSTDWLKCKIRLRESFIVGGYETKGRNQQLTNLLVGTKLPRGLLEFAGRVGSGWSMHQATELVAVFRSLTAHGSPFSQVIPPASTGRHRGDQALDVHWLRPVTVVEVAFAGWTDSGLLRQPAWVGLQPEPE